MLFTCERKIQTLNGNDFRTIINFFKKNFDLKEIFLKEF